MIDIMLDKEGDLVLSEGGDILITNSILQAIRIRLRWIYNEWRLGPEYGFPWFEEVFVKNPNTQKIRQLVRDEIMKVEGVTSAFVISVKYDPARRTATFDYTCTVGEEKYREEVVLYG